MPRQEISFCGTIAPCIATHPLLLLPNTYVIVSIWQAVAVAVAVVTAAKTWNPNYGGTITRKSYDWYLMFACYLKLAQIPGVWSNDGIWSRVHTTSLNITLAYTEDQQYGGIRPHRSSYM